MTASRGVVTVAPRHLAHGTSLQVESLTGTHSDGLLEAPLVPASRP